VKPSAAALVRSPQVLVIAHRGDSRAAPENTLAAFASAMSLGVDLVELDYLHTADGVPVVFHDDELDRLTDAPARWGPKIPLATKSLAELKQLDAGGCLRRNSPARGSRPWRRRSWPSVRRRP